MAEPVKLHHLFDNAKAVRKFWCIGDDEKNSAVPDKPLPDIEILRQPFKVCWIDNFFQDDEYLNDLVNFLETEAYIRRESDMFTYHQMDDDKFMANPLIQRLQVSFVQTVIPFMSKVTGTNLKEQKITISASKYIYSDHLLCHDDMVGDRKIAFIIYLSKEWEPDWGGTLDLFRQDYFLDPGQDTTSLVPKFNRLLFFEVASYTYHQVSEIIKPGAIRYSINGWFHGDKEVVKKSSNHEDEQKV